MDREDFLDVSPKDEIVDLINQELAGTKRRLGEIKDQIDSMQTTLCQRIDDTNRRINELRQFLLWGFGMTIAGMFALVGL